MAEWNDNVKHPKSSINNGQQYTKDDNVTLESLNNTIENSFYAVRVAENAQSATNNAVSYNAQTPLATEQIQAQKNLGIDQTITFAESERQKSKNLFKSNFWNKSSNIYEVNGITFTYNPNDYSITINGTATSRALCYLNPDALSNIKIGTYAFSGFSKKTDYSVYIQAFNEADGKYPALLYSDSDFRTVTFNIMPNFTDLYIAVDAGLVVDNLVLKFQAEEGSVATDYQPYNGEIVHEKKLNEIVNGKYPIDINACTTYDQVYNLLQNATCGKCGIGVEHTNAIKSLLPAFPTNASYVDCVANVIKNKYTESINLYAIRFTGCPFSVNQPIYYCDVFYDGENTTVTGWYKPEISELIYEINTKNTIGGKSFTAGIPFSNISISNVAFNKYKYLRFTCRWNYHGDNWFGGAITFDLDLTTPYNSDSEYMSVISSRPSSCYVADNATTFDLVGQIIVNGNKNSLSVNGYKITYTGERTAYTSDNYLPYFRIEKMEGFR